MSDLKQLSERLHELADTPPSVAPTGRLLERGRRVKHRRAAALASTSLAVLALGAVTSVAVVEHADAPADRPSASAVAVDARTQLVAAIISSQSTSYQMKIADNVAPDRTGAFAPATKTGFLRSPYSDGPGFSEERLVDGVLYIGDAGLDGVLHWQRVPGKRDTLRYDESIGDTLSGTADPDGLFTMLQHEGVTVTRTGERTYHFEVSPKLDQYRLSDHYAGDVTLDAQNRVAKVSFERVVDWTKPGGRDLPPVHITATITYSGYGEPVTVEAPTLG